MLSRSTVIALLAFLTLIDLFGPQALLPTLAAAYGVDAATMGAAVNASTVGMAIAGLAVAFFSRRIDRRRGIAVSLALLSIPTFLLGVVDDLMSFAALRVVQGLLMASAFALTMAYLAERCSGAEAAAAMAAYITGNVLSNLLGRIVSAGVAGWAGIETSFWAFAALNLAGAALARVYLGRTVPREATDAATPPLAVWAAHLRNPALRAGFAIGFLILFVFLGVFTYVNVVLAEPPLALGPAELGLVYLVFLPALITTPLTGQLVARLGTTRAFVLAMGVATAGLALLLAQELALILLGLAAVGAGTFGAQAIVSGFVGRAAAQDSATASGLYLASYYLGGLLGALIVGRIFALTGWGGAVLVMAFASTLTVVLAQRLRAVPARRASDPA